MVHREGGGTVLRTLDSVKRVGRCLEIDACRKSVSEHKVSTCGREVPHRERQLKGGYRKS